jgi:hypothetical protein
MQIDAKSSAGGGCLIFAGFILGALLGILYGQASFGVMIGTAIGIAAAVAMWFAGRKRDL